MDFIAIWCHVWTIMVVSIFSLAVLGSMRAGTKPWILILDFIILSLAISSLVMWITEYVIQNT